MNRNMDVRQGHRDRLRKRFVRTGLAGFEDYEAVDSMWFRVPLMGVVLMTAVAGALAGIAAAFSVFRRQERSVLMFLALIVLVLVVTVLRVSWSPTLC
jgi:apolipoprotein N-acyltransferase